MMAALKRFTTALMAVFGFILIFGGVDYVEQSQDYAQMLVGFLISVMGLVLMLCVAMLTADRSPEWLDRDDV
jgi:cytochrome c biogenesis protein CcdA